MKESAEIHAAIRAKQRYNLTLDTQDLIWIAQRIRGGDKVRRIAPENTTGTIHEWWVQMPKGRIRVVYDESTRMVVTVLPLKDTPKKKSRVPEVRQSRKKYEHHRYKAAKAKNEEVDENLM